MYSAHLKRWASARWLMASAWVDLALGDRDLKAAEALFRANRAAKQGLGQSETYMLKNHLVRLFYQKGYCLRTIKAVQTLECWHTQGYVEGWDPVCRKCGNTGVYAQHELYHFTFSIGGKAYNWHQPERLVDWPVKISAEPVIYNQRAVEVEDYGDAQAERDQMLLYVYLRMAGIAKTDMLPGLIDFRTAWRGDWRQSRADVKAWVLRKVRKRRGRVAKAIEDWANDGIPF